MGERLTTWRSNVSLQFTLAYGPTTQEQAQADGLQSPQEVTGEVEIEQPLGSSNSHRPMVMVLQGTRIQPSQ